MGMQLSQLSQPVTFNLSYPRISVFPEAYIPIKTRQTAFNGSSHSSVMVYPLDRSFGKHSASLFRMVLNNHTGLFYYRIYFVSPY